MNPAPRFRSTAERTLNPFIGISLYSGVLVTVRQQRHMSAEQSSHPFPRLVAVPRATGSIPEHTVHIVVVMKSQTNLLEIVFALRPASGLASLLNCWQQQGNQNCDDRNDDQQLNQREPLVDGKEPLKTSQFRVEKWGERPRENDSLNRTGRNAIVNVNAKYL